MNTPDSQCLSHHKDTSAYSMTVTLTSTQDKLTVVLNDYSDWTVYEGHFT